MDVLGMKHPVLGLWGARSLLLKVRIADPRSTLDPTLTAPRFRVLASPFATRGHSCMVGGRILVHARRRSTLSAMYISVQAGLMESLDTAATGFVLMSAMHSLTRSDVLWVQGMLAF